MKISLEQIEIEKAISHYIDTKYFKLAGKHLEIEFLSGRNPPTVTANIDIVDDAVETADPIKPDTAEDTPFSDEQQNLPFS